MKPSQQCKQAGLKSLAELSRITGVSEQTLINWHRDKPLTFNATLQGALAILKLKRDKKNKEEEARKRWISVKHKMPKYFDTVLVSYYGDSVNERHRRTSIGTLRNNDTFTTSNIGIVHPTHWQPLPPPPKD